MNAYTLSMALFASFNLNFTLTSIFTAFHNLDQAKRYLYLISQEGGSPAESQRDRVTEAQCSTGIALVMESRVL